ncbi:MAG: hypothetical protein NTZ90_01560 [Proteobacteria bacterium]|nr:hypothetical protein [Pseudomonadota bacterium]
MINDINDSNGRVTALFGVGMKLPFNSNTEFGTAALGQGSVANAIQLAKSQGDTPGPITSVPISSNPDKGWVPGWTIENISSKVLIKDILSVKTDYVTQVDQCDLGGGYYMYTSQLTKSVETMKDYQLLTAAFDISTATIKFMYTSATAK